MTIQATGIVPTLTLGQRLVVAMEYANLKPETMATRMRCSATTIRNYISGRTRIDFAHLAMWSQITGVDLDWLETGSSESRARFILRKSLRNSPATGAAA